MAGQQRCTPSKASGGRIARVVLRQCGSRADEGHPPGNGTSSILHVLEEVLIGAVRERQKFFLCKRGRGSAGRQWVLWHAHGGASNRVKQDLCSLTQS